MKIPETLKLSRLLRKDRRGVALVTVLTVMALTTILVLTFFSLATSEHRASNTYSHGLQAQQVAEEAVNLVIAQIREATTIGTSTAWASQPGAIRNWDEGGNPESAFKLYSDDQMKTMDWTDFQTDFLEASNWSSVPRILSI
jgi:Tfp pilus assembly protein PilX